MKKLKLTGLSNYEINKQQSNSIKGGEECQCSCGCACCWVGQGGYCTSENRNANKNLAVAKKGTVMSVNCPD